MDTFRAQVHTQVPSTKTFHILPTTMKSYAYEWRLQDLVRGGHKTLRS